MGTISTDDKQLKGSLKIDQVFLENDPLIWFFLYYMGQEVDHSSATEKD